MQGIFYGIGVGPGDPELLTVKAMKRIQECEVLAIAISDPNLTVPQYNESGNDERYESFLEKCVAYQIVYAAIPEIKEKAKLFLPMPMMKDKVKLKAIHDVCADHAKVILESGKNIAFITLGDPSVYSTCLYVHRRIQKLGYQTELIPGITSFCAAAARMNMGLVENQEELHIIPASYEIEESLNFPGTKVLMKTGKKMAEVKNLLRQGEFEIKMVENCGMKNEKIYQSLEEIPDSVGYYSLMIAKEGKAEGSKR